MFWGPGGSAMEGFERKICVGFAFNRRCSLPLLQNHRVTLRLEIFIYFILLFFIIEVVFLYKSLSFQIFHFVGVLSKLFTESLQTCFPPVQQQIFYFLISLFQALFSLLFNLVDKHS